MDTGVARDLSPGASGSIEKV